MCEAGYFGQVMGLPGLYVDRLAPALRRAHRDFLLIKKMHKLSCSQPRFTPARLNRKVQTSPSVYEYCIVFAPNRVYFLHQLLEVSQPVLLFPGLS